MRGEHGVSEIDPLKRNSILRELHLVRLHTPATRNRRWRRVKKNPHASHQRETFNTVNVNSELMRVRLGADVTVFPHDQDLAFSDGDETQTVHLHNRKQRARTHTQGKSTSVFKK